MAKAVIEITNKFADETTRKLEIGPVDSDAAVAHSLALKANVASINSDTSTLGSIYLSEGGASFIGITGAAITITDEREINLNDD